MMEHEIEYFHFVTFLQLTILAFSHTVTTITKVLQH